MRNPIFSLAAAVMASALTLPAQWNEVGDAGDMPRTAQVPAIPTQSFPSIVGSFASGGDVDMYLIQITDIGTFQATTVGGATADTQLWLFHADGRGVTSNDDATAVQSTITGAFVPYAGLYYLAVSQYDVDPRSAGNFLWNDTPFNVERRPDGPHRGEALDGWTGIGSGASNYTIALTGCERPRKQVVAPDSHHLAETPAVTLGGGSANWWRNGGGRFQVLYESSHFTNAGYAGGWLDKLLFRGEDGEPNAGGQSWAGVTVRLATTPLTPATLGADFAANLATATSSSALGTIPTVTVRRSAGSFPNNYNIEIDLFAAFNGYNYNPANGNLLIDVTMPTAAVATATSGAVMAIQDTAGAAATIRGSGVTTATATATTGALSSTPPVIGFGVDSPSGGAAPVIPATNETFGGACGGSPSSFYQSFRNGQAFDLDGLTLTPNNVGTPAFYVVTAGAGTFDATKVNVAPNSVGDDSVVSHPLGFTLNFPGGSTTAIAPCTNGYVWLNGTSTTGDFSPTVAEFLGSVTSSVARLAPYWADLFAGRNTAINAIAGMHVLTDTSGGPGNAVAYVTWLDVGVFNSVGGAGIAGHASYDFQVAIFEATGVIEFRYGDMPSHAQSSDVAIVGFSRGRIAGIPSVDPQSRDLSVEAPFTTSVEGASGNIGQLVKATPDVGGATYGGRAYAGQTLTFDAVGVPAGAAIGVQLIDIAQNTPGVFVPTITAPGCVLSTTLNPTLFQVSLFPPATVVGTAPLAIPAGIDGFQLVAQYAVLDGLFGGPNLVTSASNAVRVTVGKR